MTTIKQIMCGAATVGLVAGTGSMAGAPTAALTTADWVLAAEHVLLIGTDGTNLDKILKYAYTDGSGFKTAMDDGTSSATTIVNHTTVSGPSWTTTLTGVWDTKHGVINNLFRPEPYNSWPTVFNLLEYHKPEIDTSVIADWHFINDIAAAGGYPADTNIFIPFENDWADTDAQVVADTVTKIQEIGDHPDISSFLFSYQVQVDEAGHGYGGGSPEYEQAVINVGANIQQILAAVAQVEQTTGEDWTILITTDHGHQQSHGFGHGFQSPNETSTFVILDLAGNHGNVGDQNLDYSTVDVTPTILSQFGVPLRSDFDGVPMQSDPTILNSLVDPVNLKQALGDAVSMYGYPNIGNDIALGTRTIFATIPYALDLVATNINKYLQTIVDQDIFLVSGLAELTQQVVKLGGRLVVGPTEALAFEVAHLTGSGVIPPTDPPLPPPPAGAEFQALVDTAMFGNNFYTPDESLTESELPWFDASALPA